jgi:hypothetical protein
MLHSFHFFIDSFGFLRLEQSQMQIGGDVHRKRERVIRLDAKQLRWPGAEALTCFG